jgi:riboflavin synthase
VLRVALGVSVAAELALGESVAVDGACFTVVNSDAAGFAFEATRESLACTTLGDVRSGRRVHLERAAVVGGRLGGHLVLGHVDAVGAVASRRDVGNGTIFEIRAPGEVAQFLVAKGSVTVNGVSLTVNTVQDEAKGSVFTVMIVPFTAQKTTLMTLQPGDSVNLESDVIGKYVARLLGGHRKTGDLDLEFLQKHGFA